MPRTPKSQLSAYGVTFKAIPEDILPDEERKAAIKKANTEWFKVAGKLLDKKEAGLSERRLKSIGAKTIAYMEDSNLDHCFVYEYLAKEHKISGADVTFYRKTYPSFDYLITLALELQEQKLARLMLRNKVNTQAAVFVLKNKHGWSERARVDVQQSVVDAVQEARKRLVEISNDDVVSIVDGDDNDITDAIYEEQVSNEA